MVESAVYQCPHCSTEIEATPSAEPQFVACPSCGQEIEIAAVEFEPDRADELDRNRIRQIAAEKRASTRARSYCMIAAIMAGVAAVHLVWMITSETRSAGFTWTARLEVALLIVDLAALPLFLRAARS